MSNIVAIDNFTVTSQEFVVPGGALISGVVPSVELTLTPNVGFTIDANNFSVTSANPEVDVPNCSFTQDGDNVILTVVFTVGATMPNNNLDIKICMAGSTQEVNVTLTGTIFYDTLNATPLPQNVPYNNQGLTGVTETILSQLITADSGYYFELTPTISVDTKNFTNYNLYTTDSVFDSNNRLTEIKVNADYTYPSINYTGDEINVYARAIEIPTIPVYVIGYSVSTSVPITQTLRDLAIMGVEGANYELTIDNGATFVSTGTNSVTGVIPAGNAIESINFPVAANGDTHTLTFVPSGSDLDPAFTGSWTITFLRFAESSIQIDGTVTSGDSEIIVDNSGYLALVANSDTLTQTGYVDHLITPNATCPGLSLQWAVTNYLVEADFTKTEDSPNGEFNIVNGAKLINSQSGGLILRVNLSTTLTGNNDMSYVLNNNIETYIDKVYETQEIILDNSLSATDTEYQYTSRTGIVVNTTITAGDSATICARLCPAPTVVSGSGIIQLTGNQCT